MKPGWRAFAFGVLLASTAGGALGAASSPHRVPNCRADHFSLKHSMRDLGHPTGSRQLLLVVRNRVGSACVLYGYPRLMLLDGRGPLPFVVSHHGDQVVTAARPKRILIRPGRSAVVLANKYRCDGGDRRMPRVARLEFPGQRGSPVLTLSLQPSSQYDDLAYCGPGDPGSILVVSPFEPTLAAAARFH